MRWVQFVILLCVVLVAQIALGGMITFNLGPMGRVAPDLMAIMAVFIAMRGPNVLSVMSAAWVLGFAVGVTAVGGVGPPTVLGPMSFAYAIAAWLIFRVREAVFGEHVVTQGMLALVFCAASHLVWVTAQTALSGAWVYYQPLILQAIGVSVYTALLMPVGFWLLSMAQGLFIETPVRRTRRSRRSAR